jgi:hypothetical protein
MTNFLGQATTTLCKLPFRKDKSWERLILNTQKVIFPIALGQVTIRLTIAQCVSSHLFGILQDVHQGWHKCPMIKWLNLDLVTMIRTL